MADTRTINGVPMRENSVGTAIILSIVTLGIYWLILVYRNTMDLHKALQKDATLPIVLYISGFFIPLFWIALFSINGIRLNELKEEKHRSTDMMWVVALVLHFVLAFVGSIVWAVIYDNALEELEQAGASGSGASGVDFSQVA